MDLAKEVPESANLYGVDIFGGNFPKSPPPNVHFSVNSVTKLPDEWSDTFDFVHERVLGMGLLSDEWPSAVREMYRVTKPGGSIQLCEHVAQAKNLGAAWARGLALLDEVGTNVTLELLEQQGGALCATTLVADRVLNLDLVEDSTILELNKESVADRALAGLVVLNTDPLVLDASDLSPELVNAGVLGGLISVRFRGQVAVD